MRSYRCYFFDKDGRIAGVEIVLCPDDAAAEEMARDLQRQRGSFSVELWDGVRRVMRTPEPSLR